MATPVSSLLLLWLGIACCVSAAPCSLCLPGEDISKPDYVIDLTSPIPLKTCGDLSMALGFIDEDSELCQSSRALSTLCGCPVPEGSCTICEDGSEMTRPQQQLDGLVDLGDQDTFGLERTCELVESSLNQLPNNEPACLDQPLNELQRYCGCPGHEDNNDNKKCTVCPGGEIVKDNNNIFMDLDNFGLTSCSEVKQIANTTEKGTDLCNEIQRLGTTCGCPIPDDACRLCGGRGVLADGTKFVQVSGTEERVRCTTVEARLHQVSTNSTECSGFDSLAAQCGCTVEEKFVPCTLCPGGESVPFPEQPVVGIDGLGYDYLEHTCGNIQDAVLLVGSSSSDCRSARIVAGLCGCTMPEDSCQICENAGTMTSPHQEFRWTFGAVNDAFPELKNTIDVDTTFTCEVINSFLGSYFPSGSHLCGFNQLSRASACGCSEEKRTTALVWTQRCSGILSLIGSCLIMLSILTTEKKETASTYSQIVFFISIFDLLSSITYIFGTALTPKDSGLPGAIGNAATCRLQGWMIQIGLTSAYYNVALCLYFLLIVKHGWSERKFRKVRKWFYFGICGVGFIMAFAVIPFVTIDWRWCYVSRPPLSSSWLEGIFFFILPIFLSMLAMTVISILLVHFVHKNEQKTRKRRIRAAADGRVSLSLTRRAFWQSFWFLLAFYAVWPIQFVAFVVSPTPDNYWIYFLAALLGPLQGFLNALVFFYRKRKAIKKRVLKTLRLDGKLSAFFSSRKTTATPSSMDFSSMRGRLELQSYQYRISSEEAEQLDASIGNLGPEAFLDLSLPRGELGRVNEAEEDPADDSEGLIELALNSGLVSMEELDVFQMSKVTNDLNLSHGKDDLKNKHEAPTTHRS